MAFTAVTVNFAFVNPDGSLPSGWLSFAPVVEMSNGTSVVAAEPVRVQLVAGAGSVVLYATDDAGTLPVGNVYRVTKAISGEATPAPQFFALPRAVTPVDLSALVPLFAAPQLFTYALAADLTTANTAIATKAALLAVAATVTAAGPLVVNKHNPVDATSAPLTMTLPTGQAQGSLIIAEKYDVTTNAVTLSGNIRGVPASTDVLVLPHQTTMFEADAAGSWWPVSSHKPLASLDTRYILPLVQYDIRTYGAKCDGKRVTDGSIGTGTNVLTSVSNLFAASDVGKQISVTGAGAAGVNLVTTIAGFTNAGSVTLTANASTTASGATTTWGTDDTTAVQAAITAAQAAGGGKVFVPNWSICLGQLTFTRAGNYRQAPVWLCGAGKWVDSDLNVNVVNGGSILDLWYNGGGVAKIDTRGIGVLEIDHIALVDSSWGAVPFIQTTSTTLYIHDCYFGGNPGKSGANLNCDQDAIVLGSTGTTTNSGAATDAFQGYGTVIKANFFSSIRRGVFGQGYANSIVVRDNTWSVACGATIASGAAAIDFSAPLATSSSGNWFDGNLIEVTHYGWAVQCSHSSDNYIANSYWDLTTDSTVTAGLVNLTNSIDNYVLLGNGISVHSPQVAVLDPNLKSTILNFASSTGIVPNSSIYPHVTDFSGGLVTSHSTGIQFSRNPGQQQRTVTDGVLNSTTTITSATAVFAAGDVGNVVVGTGIPLLATIASVTNATTAVLSAAATATASGVSLTITPITGSISRNSLTNLQTAVAFNALGDLNQFGPNANFVGLGALGTGDAWVDARGSSSNIALNLRAKGTKPIIFNSHLEPSTSAPTVAAVGANATSVGVGISTDNSGTVTLTTAASLGADTSVVTVTFNKAFGGASGAPPRGLVLSANNGASAAAQAFVASSSTTTFTVALHNPPAGAVAMSFSWVAF